jgi:uncharacterized protein (TIGR03790 family)
VPASQIFGFALSAGDEISRAEFRDKLQEPLAKAIADRKLWRIASHIVPATTNRPAHVEWRPVESKIRYAVLCYGVPLKVAHDPNLKEEAAEKLRPEMRRDEAAVDSELALLPMLEERLPLTGLIPNWVFGVTNRASLGPTNGVLLVARLDGPNPVVARGLVDKALQAEADGLWGRAYFDLRNTTDPGYKSGDDWIRGAAEICHRYGFETIVDENPGTFPAGFPMSQIAIYLGWYTEGVSGPFAQPTVEFMPGAIAYHLHSGSASTLRSTNYLWAGSLLGKGAAATMGCVYEPYLGGTPHLGLFAARLISGFSFGEAAYASEPVLSWQITVVGDPLYRPFAKNPEQLHDALAARRSKLIEWSFLRLLDLNLANGKDVADGVLALEQLELTKQSAVLSEKLGDLYAAQGKPSTAVYAYAQALRLGPSPQQTIRLLLTLGEKLTALDRPVEAYDAYKQLLTEFPDYPDQLTLYRKLLPLAQKLNKKTDAEKFEAEIQRLAPPPATPPQPGPGGSNVPVGGSAAKPALTPPTNRHGN